MRRRSLIGEKKPLVLTLSSYSYNATPANGSTTVYAYYGGVPISDLTSSMTSYGGIIYAVSVNSSGAITMRYISNESTTSTKTGTMELTYQGQTKTFTITQAKDYVTSTSTTYETYGTGGLTRDPRTILVTDNGDGTSTSTNDITMTYTLKTDTVTTTKYASLKTDINRTTTSSTEKTCTVPKEFLKFDQSKDANSMLINTNMTRTEDYYEIYMRNVSGKCYVYVMFAIHNGSQYGFDLSAGGWGTNPTSVKLNIFGRNYVLD